MPQSAVPFQYQAEKNDSSLTGFAGLPLYVELAVQSGLVQYINQTMKTKMRGWTDAEMILSLVLLNLAGGDCISDIERLEQDAGLKTLLTRFATHGLKRKERRVSEKRWRKAKNRGLPSNAAIHRYLPQFHSPEEENNRVEGEAFIPKPNDKLSALIGLNKPLIACVQQQSPSTIATLDQDATLTNTYKRKALYCYKGFKAYQPFNTYWAEHGILLHSEFRDGNVNAGFGQLRILKEAMALLPFDVKHVHGTQKEGLAGGQLPSNLFGVNAAWWAMMVLSFNLNRLMQIAALPKDLKESKMKALRFHVIQLPGRLIHHARHLYIRVEGHCCELLQLIRDKIAKVRSGGGMYAANTS